MFLPAEKPLFYAPYIYSTVNFKKEALVLWPGTSTAM